MKDPVVRHVHRHQWLWEPLEDEATFVLRSMFGAKAAYLDGRLVLCFCAGEDPWQGVLVCTEREHHAALQAEFSALSPHPVLPKWLYLPETNDVFEKTAERLVRLARQRDPRLGIIPKPRKKKNTSASRRSRKPRP